MVNDLSLDQIQQVDLGMDDPVEDVGTCFICLRLVRVMHQAQLVESIANIPWVCIMRDTEHVIRVLVILSGSMQTECKTLRDSWPGRLKRKTSVISNHMLSSN